jgi:hypothetical protein
LKGIRIRQYSEGAGFFKKYLSDCLNLDKPQNNSNSQSNQPLISNHISRAQAVLSFKQKDPTNFNKATELKYMPRDFRWSVWYINITINALLNNDSYQRLVRSYQKDVITIVKKDVPRTFSTNPFFKEKIDGVEVGRDMLYKTCKAIGTYFQDVGYCQGLNFLVGFLL